jgi:hypothetical protein
MMIGIYFGSATVVAALLAVRLTGPRETGASRPIVPVPIRPVAEGHTTKGPTALDR